MPRPAACLLARAKVHRQRCCRRIPGAVPRPPVSRLCRKLISILLRQVHDDVSKPLFASCEKCGHEHFCVGFTLSIDADLPGTKDDGGQVVAQAYSC